MKLKKIDDSKMKNLYSKLDSLIQEYDSYVFKSIEEVDCWMNSLPIESLMDLCLYSNGKSTSKISMKNLERKKILIKEYAKTKEIADLELHSLNIQKINLILEKIKNEI